MKTITVSLHGGGPIRIRGDYTLRLNDEGRVVVVVGKAEHETNWTSVKKLQRAIFTKRKVRPGDTDTDTDEVA